MKSLFLSSSFFSRKIVDIVQVFISLICKKKKKGCLKILFLILTKTGINSGNYDKNIQFD